MEGHNFDFERGYRNSHIQVITIRYRLQYRMSHSKNKCCFNAGPPSTTLAQW